MSVRLPPDLLSRSPEESSRLVALSYLDEIDRAERRLHDAQDAAALHDFRVGVRRLRSCIRAYREPLKGSVSGKMRQRLRQLAQATSLGRDTEVQLVWLGQQLNRLEAEDVQGFFWLSGRQEGHRLDSHAPAIAEVARRYAKTGALLRRRLGVLRIEVGTDPARKPLTFGQVSGEMIGVQVARLRKDLLGIRDASSIEEAHQARIAVKRLRYLLEPVARSNRRARALIPRLKQAQDLLGEHHDMHVLATAIASARAGLSGANPQISALVLPGLATLERFAGEQAVGAFERFLSILDSELRSRTLVRAEEIGQLLKDGPAGPGFEIGVPAPASAPREDIDQARSRILSQIR